jgi:hypothetical protein
VNAEFEGQEENWEGDLVALSDFDLLLLTEVRVRESILIFLCCF